MTRVDFYVLRSTDPAARLAFACRLVDKAWKQGMPVYVHCADAEQRQRLDEQLWAFRPDSFVPHDLAENASDSPVVLGLTTPAEQQGELLINLSLAPPPCHAGFARIAEVVVEAPEVRQAMREGFRFYRKLGYALQDHQLSRV